MTDNKDIDYGPLAGLIGTWRGDNGIDVAPEPDDTERNSYYENITFAAIGDVDNAEEQQLVIVNYRQSVYRKSNDEHFHDQCGYFTWEAATGLITHSFAIPRGVAIVAGGKVIEQAGERTVLQVAAADGARYQPGRIRDPVGSIYSTGVETP